MKNKEMLELINESKESKEYLEKIFKKGNESIEDLHINLLIALDGKLKNPTKSLRNNRLDSLFKLYEYLLQIRIFQLSPELIYVVFCGVFGDDSPGEFSEEFDKKIDSLHRRLYSTYQSNLKRSPNCAHSKKVISRLVYIELSPRWDILKKELRASFFTPKNRS